MSKLNIGFTINLDDNDYNIPDYVNSIQFMFNINKVSITELNDIKKFISTKEAVFEDLTTGKSSRNGGGNYTWKLIVKSPLDTNIVCCHTALIRKLYKKEDFIFKNVVLDMFELSLPQNPLIVNFFKESIL